MSSVIREEKMNSESKDGSVFRLFARFPVTTLYDANYMNLIWSFNA